MVTITKPPKRNNAILCKKIVAFISLIILLWVGVHWLSWFHATFILSDDDANSYNNQLRNRKQQQQPLPKIIGVPQPKQQQPQQREKDNIADHHHQQYQQKVQSILSTISKLSNSIPLSPTNNSDNNLSTKFTSIISKQCIPGRDDTSTGEIQINPTTHRKRECLRHVPLGKHHTTSDVEHSFQTQKPRIGIFVPPTFIGQSIALLIQHVILQTGDDEIHMMDVEIIITSHVPVYGYGKSHGYTKLIRVVEMPLSLGVMDAYLYSSSMLLNGSDGSDHNDFDWTKEGDNEVAENRGGGRNEYYQNALKDTIDELKLGRRVQPPSIGTVGQLVSLMMRWHCRMSHVSAHTAMVTLSLEDLLTDPTTIISNILSFIWREDWDWEGHNGGQTHPHQSQPKYATWKLEAEEIVTQQLKDTSSLLYMLTKHTQLLLHETISTNDESDDDNNAFKKSIQGAFASEMKRSSDMTSWPCPSFWEGVDTSTDASDDNDQLRILQQISNEMIPNCRDDDPFVRCSVNKDKCEVKRDAKCK